MANAAASANASVAEVRAGLASAASPGEDGDAVVRRSNAGCGLALLCRGVVASSVVRRRRYVREPRSATSVKNVLQFLLLAKFPCCKLMHADTSIVISIYI